MNRRDFLKIVGITTATTCCTFLNFEHFLFRSITFRLPSRLTFCTFGVVLNTSRRKLPQITAGYIQRAEESTYL